MTTLDGDLIAPETDGPSIGASDASDFLIGTETSSNLLQNIAPAVSLISETETADLQFSLDAKFDVVQEVITVAYVSAGDQGPAGPAGAMGSGLDAEGSAVSDVSIAAGVPVYVSPASRHLRVADPAAKYSSMIVGLMAYDIEAGFVGVYKRAQLALEDWTDITGAQQLLPGQLYFLTGPGRLGTQPFGNPFVTRVGLALDPQTLAIDPSITPIQL